MRGGETAKEAMKLSEDELIEILSDVTTLLGTALAQHVELTESLLDQNAGAQVQQKIDALKAKLDDERARLKKLHAAQQRRRELEKIRKDHERNERTPANEDKATSSRVGLYNGRGRLIGWLHNEPNGKVTVYDARGRLVARELAGITLDRTGRFVGRGRQGLVVLGQRLAA
jgi:YD repeat-containing protein